MQEDRFQPVSGRHVERGLCAGGWPAARPSADTHLDPETPVSALRHREAWGWLRADTLREPGHGASHGGSAGRCPDPSAMQGATAGERREKCVQLPRERLFQGRAPPTLFYVSSRWLPLPSWTPGLAGAVPCPWGYAWGQAPEHRYKRDRGQHVLRKETASLQTKNSPHAKNILNPHKLHRGAHAYKQLSKTMVD